MSKREKCLVGVSVVVFAAVIFLSIQVGFQRGLPKTQKEKAKEKIENMLLRHPEVPFEQKAEIVADRAATAVDRIMNPVSLKEKAEELEAKRLAHWKANFPWKPTHDPDVQFDPDVHLTWQINPMEASEEEMRRWEARELTNTQIYAGANHKKLKRFFEDEIRFTRQFEQCYRILKEHGRGHNPVQVLEVFEVLRDYQYTTQFDPEEELPKEKQWSGEVTWGDRAEQCYEYLMGDLNNSGGWLNARYASEAGKAEAIGIRDRLIREVKGMNELPERIMDYANSGSGFTKDSPEGQALINGEEELLVPYVGWYRESQEYWGEQTRQFRISYEEGDPSLKAVAPELFPPVGVKNNQLVDKDGDPVKWREGLDVTLINERGEVVPVIVEENGTVSLPTPAEVAAMREQGKIEPAPEGMLMNLPTRPLVPQPPAPMQTPAGPMPLTPEERMVLDMIMEQMAK